MTFTPERITITGITNADPCVVTTGQVHGLITGSVVRLHVPQNYGMYQLNQLAVSVSVISLTTFSLQYTQTPLNINVDSTNFEPFILVSKPQFTAEVIPIGSGPTLEINPTAVNRTIFIDKVNDSFRNNSTTEIPF
jgi:hypothetical protein